MQIKDLFRENMLLEVYDSASGVYYKSLLQEVDDTGLAIGIPMMGGKSMILQQESSYLCRVPQEDALYYFRSKVIGGKKEDRVPLYLLSWPDRLERHQRRGYFRLACSIDVDYWPLGGYAHRFAPDREQSGAGRKAADLRVVTAERREEKWDSETRALYQYIRTKKPRQGVASNLSGGGLLLVTRFNLQPGTPLALRFFLQSNGGEKKEILVQGRVTRTMFFKLGRLKRYRCGVKFWKISERVQDEIIRFIFSMLRQRIR